MLLTCQQLKDLIIKVKKTKSQFEKEFKDFKNFGVKSAEYERVKESLAQPVKELVISNTIFKLDNEIQKYINKRMELYTISESVSDEEIEHLSGIKNLNCNLYDVPQSIKDTITSWNGNISDGSRSVSYPNLKTLAGSFGIASAKTFTANVLESAGTIWAPNLTEFSLGALKSVAGDMHVTKSVKFKTNELQNVSGTIFAHDATVFEAMNLENVEKIIISKNKIKPQDVHVRPQIWEKISYQ